MKHASRPIRPRLAFVVLVLAATSGGLARPASPVRGQPAAGGTYLPREPIVVGGRVAPLRRTATAAPTPTPPGGRVSHPDQPEDIILQIGATDTDQVGPVRDQMNGTPWLTLYGDGHLIAGRTLFDNRRELFEAHTDEEHIQQWLRELVYGVDFFSLQADYGHPLADAPAVHVYVDTTGGQHLVHLAGFLDWETRDAPDEPDAPRIQRLTRFVRDLRHQLSTELDEPYTAERYTILVQHVTPSVLPNPPTWIHSLDLRAEAEAAPTELSDPHEHVTAHRIADRQLEEEVRDTVWPATHQSFPDKNWATEFTQDGRSYTVGARQEVPGGTLFLPLPLYRVWYRRDPAVAGMQMSYGKPATAANSGEGSCAVLVIFNGPAACGASEGRTDQRSKRGGRREGTM